MEEYRGLKTFYAKNRAQWRRWLSKYGEKEDRVWLILYNKAAETTSINYVEAVEEALCFGWIDSKANRRDDESRYQLFARRNPKSAWSELNKQRVKELIRQNKMEAAGLSSVEIAKANGAWDALSSIDKLEIPDDLGKALAKNTKARKNFQAFPPSIKKQLLHWISSAKRPETRIKRIAETVSLAAENQRANQWKKS